MGDTISENITDTPQKGFMQRKKMVKNTARCDSLLSSPLSPQSSVISSAKIRQIGYTVYTLNTLNTFKKLFSVLTDNMIGIISKRKNIWCFNTILVGVAQNLARAHYSANKLKNIINNW